MVDKKGTMHEHSRIKLKLYELYLARYFSVLSAYGRFNEITVHDIFAGQGHSVDGEGGSPIICAREIAKNKNRFPKTDIYLKLNDNDPEKVSSLKRYMEPFPFASVTNLDADEYIQNFEPKRNTQNLFFIDPHGYTQVSITNLKQLFRKEHCEFLIFIPISHIYRFLRKEESAEQLKPIAKFLSQLGIGESEAKSAGAVEDFADLVLNALRKMAKTDYGYKQILENKANSNRYCLFFLTHHILGAEKFLEAQDKLRQQLASEPDPQLSFNFVEEHKKLPILKIFEKNKPYDNRIIYEMVIKAGVLPKVLVEELKILEKSGSIIINECPGQKRKKKGFYINYPKWKDEKRISITFRG